MIRIRVPRFGSLPLGGTGPQGRRGPTHFCSHSTGLRADTHFS